MKEPKIKQKSPEEIRKVLIAAGNPADFVNKMGHNALYKEYYRLAGHQARRYELKIKRREEDDSVRERNGITPVGICSTCLFHNKESSGCIMDPDDLNVVTANHKCNSWMSANGELEGLSQEDDAGDFVL